MNYSEMLFNRDEKIIKIIEEKDKEIDKYEEVLNKIKEKLEKYNDKEANMYAPVQECLELLEEIE